MNDSELRDKTPDQLREELEGFKKEAIKSRFKAATGQLENTAQMKKVRRNAARVKTILNKKARAAASEAEEMPKRILQGTVDSDKNDKTVTVLVERRFKHPLMKKTVRKSKKYRAHDENNQFKTGDTVRSEECAPISKTKRWTAVLHAQAQLPFQLDRNPGA